MTVRILGVSLFVIALHASTEAARAADGDPFVDRVVEFKPGEGAGYGKDMLPKIVLGPPYGQGQFMGGGDVCSLGKGGSITLEFVDNEVIDEEGPDLIVFENAFLLKPGDDAAPADPDRGVFDPAKIEVSQDGKTWHEFPFHAASGKGCAGRRPVTYNPDTPEGKTLDVQDPKQAGGDAFDLAELKLKSIRFVRITDLGLSGGEKGTAGFDLDAIVAAHSRRVE